MTDVSSNGMTMSFVAPGEGSGSPQQRVAGYEVRIRASTEMTEDELRRFDAGDRRRSPSTIRATSRSFDVTSLLPETDYWIGVRAYDGCHNIGPVAITQA